ncbi:MAG TPA: MotA/TolQ/ExbB proton channel family protein [Planctomycetota bacterium]|nr:MotA/TolQ/ExbB proton channel family protein [Planctomycetota bacterium]
MSRPVRFAALIPVLLAGGAAAAAQGGGAAVGEDPLAWTHSVWGWIRASGTIGIAILVQSVFVGALIVEQYVTLRRERLAPPALLEELRSLLDERSYRDALALCESHPCFLANVVAAGLAHVGHPYETIEKVFTEAGEAETIKLHQKVGWLSTHANIAPMLGLLGTVQGMILAFNTIVRKRGQASPADFAGDIAVALLTTLFGLLVAIPVTAVFVQMRNKATRVAIEIGDVVADLFEPFREAKA